MQGRDGASHRADSTRSTKAERRPALLSITLLPAASANIGTLQTLTSRHINNLVCPASLRISLHCWCPQHSTTTVRDRSRIDSAHSERQQAEEGCVQPSLTTAAACEPRRWPAPGPRAAGRACHAVVQGRCSSLPTSSSTFLLLDHLQPTASMAMYGRSIRHHGLQWRGSGTNARHSDQRYSGLERVLSWSPSRATLASSRSDVSPLPNSTPTAACLPLLHSTALTTRPQCKTGS